MAANDVCKLTGATGDFVASHLIPRALTKPDRPGRPFIQAGVGTRPERRVSSWYDRQLVTRQGEDILSAYDNWGIRELRKHRLIWSSWGPSSRLRSAAFQQIPDSPYGIRSIEGIDTDRFRTFLLSLLWRAAATSRHEFSEIELPPEDLERLRSMVLNGCSQPLDFYPISLTQLSTRGPVHNQTPLAQEKIIPGVEGGADLKMPIFRFYFDGLIVHFNRTSEDGFTTEHMGPLAVGFGPKIVASTVTFETSFQRENLARVVGDAKQEWPRIMKRLNGLR